MLGYTPCIFRLLSPVDRADDFLKARRAYRFCKARCGSSVEFFAQFAGYFEGFPSEFRLASIDHMDLLVKVCIMPEHSHAYAASFMNVLLIQ